MQSGYFRERQRYTKAEIAANLGRPVDTVIDILRKLKSSGVLKAVRSSLSGIDFKELQDNDFVVSDVDIDSPSQLFVFDYVGVVTVGSCIFKIFPKYIKNQTDLLTQLQQVLKVIRRYNAKVQTISMTNGLDLQEPFNMLPIMMFLVSDYIENGVYVNIRDITEINGEGEIDWVRTVNEIDPYISNRHPVYAELITTQSIEDERDYFRRLHRCIAASCYAALKVEELDVLFSLPSEISCEEEITDFGEKDYILYRLKREMNLQFITRKQMLLRTMYAFISQHKASPDAMSFSMYGTNCFNLIWEKVCTEVFGNVLLKVISRLPVPLAEEFVIRNNSALIDLIKRPIWTAFLAGGDEEHHRTKDTLIPDIVSIYIKGGEPCFGIFDAKYYTIKLDANGVYNQPGIGDITKQYLYQLAFNTFIRAHKFAHVQNAFLLPTSDEQASACGKVSLNILESLPTNPKLSDILAVELPARQMYAWYLDGRTISINNEFPML
ncbi:LlaJI family restriction endonuclease [Chloroflexota bacterium]